MRHKKRGKSALTGHATVIIEGLATGMASTAIPVMVIVLASIAAYFIPGGFPTFVGSLRIGLASVGLLSTWHIPGNRFLRAVADNAGGTRDDPPAAVRRQRTDALDSLGNTTAATGKGFAIGSAALTTLALIAAFKEQVLMLGEELSTCPS